MNNWTKEDIDLFKKMIDAVSRGFVVNGKQLTDLYNKILDRKLTPTNCMQCLRGRYNELKISYDAYVKNNPEETEQEFVQAKKVTRKKSKNV